MATLNEFDNGAVLLRQIDDEEEEDEDDDAGAEIWEGIVEQAAAGVVNRGG